VTRIVGTPEPSDVIIATILGREYRFSCPPEERAALLAAVEYVEGKVASIRDVGKGGNERIAVFAALNIANELLSLRSSQDGSADIAIGEFRRRIENINAAIDAALTPQEKLF